MVYIFYFFYDLSIFFSLFANSILSLLIPGEELHVLKGISDLNKKYLKKNDFYSFLCVCVTELWEKIQEERGLYLVPNT